MPEPRSLCFARLAIRFAPLAPALRAPSFATSSRSSRSGPGTLRAKRCARTKKPWSRRDREDTLVGVVNQRDRGPLEPEPLDECGKRLAGDRPEDTMEMKRREGGNLGETLEREGLAQVFPDVVDDPVDTLFVLETIEIHQVKPRRAAPVNGAALARQARQGPWRVRTEPTEVAWAYSLPSRSRRTASMKTTERPFFTTVPLADHGAGGDGARKFRVSEEVDMCWPWSKCVWAASAMHRSA